MAKVQGHADAPFDNLRALLEEQIASGDELGASICLNVDGKNVVDLWGGYVDEERSKPWEKDTVVNVWSSTKTVAALAGLIQVDRGQLDLDAPVSKYWPEFAQNGKEGVLVRHFLSHTSGVSGWKENMTAEGIQDLSTAVPKLAAQAPFWPPGTASGYHAVTMGHLIGELTRRVTGKPLKQFVAEEIAGPLGADFQIGALEKDWPRISPVIPPPPLPMDFASLPQDSPTVRSLGNPPMDATVAMTPGFRKSDMAGVNGTANARSLVRILSTITLGGTLDGVKLLSPQTIEKIFEEQANGPDLVVGVPLRFGTGYGLTGGGTSESVPWFPKGKVCFWGGWGGSVILMDLDRKVTFSYTMNKMHAGILGNVNSEKYLKAVYKDLGVEGY